MTDDVQIDGDHLVAHQKHLAGLVDRVTTAREAAGTTLSPDAYGLFGSALAAECVKAQQEGTDTLQAALTASQVHHEQVGAWIGDLATNELDLVAMFRAIGDDDAH
jgi:hypothetical protein